MDNVVLIVSISSIQIRTLCTDTGLKNGRVWSCCSGATANNGTGTELLVCSAEIQLHSRDTTQGRDENAHTGQAFSPHIMVLLNC